MYPHPAVIATGPRIGQAGCVLGIGKTGSTFPHGVRTGGKYDLGNISCHG